MLLTIVALGIVASVCHAAPYNVLFFASDDARYQLGISGPGVVGPGCALQEGQGCTKMHTPNIDRLARMSLMLHKNYVQQAVCSPTRTSLLTSRRPDATRVWDLYTYWRDAPGGGNYTSLPELFRLHGYETVGMGKIFHPGHASGQGSPNCADCGPGDDLAHSWTMPYYHAPNEDYPLARDDGNLSFLSVSPADEAKYPLADSQLADNAINIFKQLEDRTEDTPFFMAVGFHRPHLPFVAPQAMYDLYPQNEIELPRRQIAPAGMPTPAWSNSGELFQYADQHKIHGSGLGINQTLPPDDVRNLRRAYYAAISHMDDQLGRVLDALLSSRFANNTVISFFGDHGWQLGEMGEWCKHTNFELATHAPMLVRVPGVTDQGLSTMSYTNHIDLLPTLAEVAMNVTVPPCPYGKSSLNVSLCTMGHSLVPLLRNTSAVVTPAAYSQYPRGAPPNETEDRATPSASLCLKKACIMGYSIVTHYAGHEWRYTEWVEFNGANRNAMDWSKNFGTELYDITGEGPEPDTNFHGHSSYLPIEGYLQQMLHAGPPPSGWGPYVPE